LISVNVIHLPYADHHAPDPYPITSVWSPCAVVTCVALVKVSMGRTIRSAHPAGLAFEEFKTKILQNEYATVYPYWQAAHMKDRRPSQLRHTHLIFYGRSHPQ